MAIVTTWWNSSVPSAVVTIGRALELHHISSMYCQQVINNPSLPLTVASTVTGVMLYRLPIPRDLYPYMDVKYILLDNV